MEIGREVDGRHAAGRDSSRASWSWPSSGPRRAAPDPRPARACTGRSTAPTRRRPTTEIAVGQDGHGQPRRRPGGVRAGQGPRRARHHVVRRTCRPRRPGSRWPKPAYQSALDSVARHEGAAAGSPRGLRAGAQEARRRGRPRPDRGRRLGAPRPGRRVHRRADGRGDHRADEPAEAADRRAGTPRGRRRAGPAGRSSASSRSATACSRARSPTSARRSTRRCGRSRSRRWSTTRDRLLKPGFFAKGVILTQLDDRRAGGAGHGGVDAGRRARRSTSIKDGTITQQEVTLGVRQGDLWEIVEGLKGDEMLATSRLNELATGVQRADAEAGRVRRRRPAAGGERRRRARAGGGRAAGPAARPGRRPAGRRAMKLADVSVRRPVFAVMMSAALLVLGWFSYRQLGLDLMPKTDYPTVTCRRGAAGRERRGDRDVDHEADRGGGQHDQRHRRAALQLEPGVRALHDHVRARARDRGGHAGRARQGGGGAAAVPARHATRRRSRRSIPTRRRSSRSSSRRRARRRRSSQIADKQIKQVLETVQDVGEVSFKGDRRREIQRPARTRTASTPTG